MECIEVTHDQACWCIQVEMSTDTVTQSRSTLTSLSIVALRRDWIEKNLPWAGKLLEAVEASFEFSPGAARKQIGFETQLQANISPSLRLSLFLVLCYAFSVVLCTFFVQSHAATDLVFDSV